MNNLKPTRDEAEMEYLKIAQDLDMCGVNYFQEYKSFFLLVSRLLLRD